MIPGPGSQTYFVCFLGRDLEGTRRYGVVHWFKLGPEMGFRLVTKGMIFVDCLQTVKELNAGRTTRLIQENARKDGIPAAGGDPPEPLEAPLMPGE